jgi:excisionase family DNA binding protein
MNHEKELSEASQRRIKLLVSKREAAEALGVCARTIDNLLRNCELTSVRIGRRRLIPAAALEKFIRRHHPTQVSEQVAVQ